MNGRSSQLTLLLLLILCFPGLAYSSDFALGVATGIAVSDSGSSSHEPKTPNKVVQFSEGGEASVSVTKEFKRGQWKKLEGPEGGYFVCEGEFRNKTGGTCQELVNHWIGKWEGRKELPLKEALELEAGTAIRLQTIEHVGSSIRVKYAETNDPIDENGSAVVGAASNTADEESESNQAFQYSGQAASPFQSMHDTLFGLLTGPMAKLLAFMMITMGIVQGIARQSFSSMVVGVGAGMSLTVMPMLLETIMQGPLPDGTSNDGTAIDNPNNDSGGWGIFVVIVPALLIFILFKLFSSRRENELDEILASVRDQQLQEQSEPVSIDELRDRQAEAEEDSVQSTSSSRPRVISESKSEPIIEIEKNKRKVILD
jgi:type IV secretory pathway VirB2 component (pilin)